MGGQPAATRPDVNGGVEAGRKRLDEGWVDGLEPRQLAPLLRLEVVHERPEHCADHAIVSFIGWNSRHLALPHGIWQARDVADAEMTPTRRSLRNRDRKSTRLNSSHRCISY